MIDRRDVPDELEPTADQLVDEELQDLDAQLLDQARKDNAEWYAQDLPLPPP